MIESLLLAACLYGTQTSCLTSAQAYYKWSGLETEWNNIEGELGPPYRIGSTVAITAYGLFYKEYMRLPTIYNFNLEMDLHNKATMLLYTRGF